MHYQLERDIQESLTFSYSSSFKMKFLTYSSVVLFHLLCVAEAVPEPDSIISILIPPTPKCGAPGYPLFACTIVQLFTIYSDVICRGWVITQEVSQAMSCAAEQFGPFGPILSSMSNSILLGAQTIQSTCDDILSSWNSSIDEMCPLPFLLINSVVALLYSGKKVVSLNKN